MAPRSHLSRFFFSLEPFLNSWQSSTRLRFPQEKFKTLDFELFLVFVHIKTPFAFQSDAWQSRVQHQRTKKHKYLQSNLHRILMYDTFTYTFSCMFMLQKKVNKNHTGPWIVLDLRTKHKKCTRNLARMRQALLALIWSWPCLDHEQGPSRRRGWLGGWLVVVFYIYICVLYHFTCWIAGL